MHFQCPYCPVAEDPADILAQRNKWMALFFVVFLGLFGLHHLYMRNTYSFCWMFFLTLSIGGLLISIPWWVKDILKLSFMSYKQFHRQVCLRV